MASMYHKAESRGSIAPLGRRGVLKGTEETAAYEGPGVQVASSVQNVFVELQAKYLIKTKTIATAVHLMEL